MSPGRGDLGPGATAVFAAADWYLERDEPEETWRGVLRRRPPSGGPADRPALAYALVTEEEPIPVYAAGVERVLEPFDERAVVVLGKLVDLAAEGFTPELWIAALEADGSRIEEVRADVATTDTTRPAPDDSATGSSPPG